MSITVDISSTEDLLDMEKAKAVGDTLMRHYPNHLWAVSWQGHALVVKNLAISSFYGFLIQHGKAATASELAAKAVLAGGELLERAGMKRGKWDGQMAGRLEGSEKRFFKPL